MLCIINEFKFIIFFFMKRDRQVKQVIPCDILELDCI